MRKLEDLPNKIYNYILKSCEDGVPPTVREIGTYLSIKSTSTVHKYLSQLEQDGLIERGKGQNRNIKIAGNDPVKKVPLVGVVAAGAPILATENIEGYIPYQYSGNGEFFALRVQGDSMIDKGILQDDLIIVKKTEQVRDG
ncbi:MAG: transcriptional repressor LexA, partial [Oscillospiraceae bacterium]